MSAPEIRDAYPVGNTSWDWFEDVSDAVAYDGADPEISKTMFVGGTLYAHAYKGVNPDATVEAVEENPYAVLLQSFAAQRLEETGDPSQVRRELHLEPYMEGDHEDMQYIPKGMWLPRERVEEAVDTRREFIENSSMFPDETAEAVDGNLNSFYGRHEEPHHTDEDLLHVDLTRTQNDIYPDLLDELDDVLEPDQIHTDQVQEADVTDAEIIFANNVPDWAGLEEFARAVDKVAADEYHVSMYSASQHGSFEDAEDAAEKFAQATGRDVRTVDYEADGSLNALLPAKSQGSRPAEYNTEEIVNGENAAILRVT